MYNISELNAMDDNQLVAIAKNMDIKKVDLSQKEDLIYRILDQQAIVAATATPEKKQRKQREQKPRKEHKEPASTTSVNEEEDTQDAFAGQQQRKGRKKATQKTLYLKTTIYSHQKIQHKKRQSPKTIPIHHLRHLRHRESLRQNDAEAVHQEQSKQKTPTQRKQTIRRRHLQYKHPATKNPRKRKRKQPQPRP